jgi:hypothetical protein
MKKLALLFVMIVLATCMAEMASADDHNWWSDWWSSIQGTYEMVATGTCLHDKTGFIFNGNQENPTLGAPYTATPKSSDHFISAYMGEGTWTFHRDGTGTMQVTQNCILPDYSGNTAKVSQAFTPSPPQPWSETIPFTYAIDGSRIRVILPIGLTLDGRISRDHETMTLQSAMPVPPQGVQWNGLIGYYQICTINRTLFRVNE